MARMGSAHWTAARCEGHFSGPTSEKNGMSHQCTTFVLTHPSWRNRTPSQTLVGVVLSWGHNYQNRECLMSSDEISLASGRKERHVRRVVQQLEALELIRREVKGKGAGG